MYAASSCSSFYPDPRSGYAAEIVAVNDYGRLPPPYSPSSRDSFATVAKYVVRSYGSLRM
jgi:hypothetical protein